MKLNYLLRLWISLVLTTSVAWGQTFTPLRQVVRRPVAEVSYEARLTVSGNYLYFVVRDDATGVEVWRTDGTPAGTLLLKDVVPGPQPTGTGVQDLVDVQGTLYFMANDTHELWKTDGTESGTVLVRAFGGIVAGLMAYNNLLIFSPPGGGLWRTDGTPAGTFQLASRFERGRGSMVIYQNSLYFYAASGPGFQETSLLKADGSEAGTTLVKQIPGTMQTIGAGVDGVYFTAI